MRLKPQLQAAFIPWRFYLLLSFILILVFGLIIRMADLTIIKRGFLQYQGNVRTLRTIKTPGFRGLITDRNGSPLAVSTSVYSVWANPRELIITPTEIKKLSQLLLVKPSHLQALIRNDKKKPRGFVYLKRGQSPEVAVKIKSLGITGIYLQEEYKRYYPEGEIAAHVIGFTNVDDKGQEGLELAYNQWLSGVSGKKVVIKDRIGRLVSEVQTLQEQKPGNDLTLSIDKRIQYLAYRALMEGIQTNQAISGSVIVLDAKTGEVLAMVNQPSYNPNNYSKRRSDAYRNRAVTDTFEPGSTIKAFTIASALESGKFRPDTLINTSPGRMILNNHLVRDEHDNGRITVSQVLQLSSNMGVSKMVLSLPPNTLWNLLHHAGFGETVLGFPGEQSGSLVSRNKWSAIMLATLSFGYGIAITPLQLAQAYSIFANNGVKKPVSILKVDKEPEGERIMSPKVAKQMLEMLESVTTAKGATGELAHVPGYRVAGKTGTARLHGPYGYQKHRHISSFVGIAPVSQPRLIVAVIINDPQGKNYYANLVSAPVFEKIMEGTLRILNVPPDDIKI